MSPGRPLEDAIVAPGSSIGEAMAHLDKVATGALALCAPDGKLLGLLTDGDIRRAILRGASLDDPCESIANLHPITARGSISAADALHLMTQRDINHLPVVDEEGVFQALLLRKDLIVEKDLVAGVSEFLDAVIVPPQLPILEAMARLDRAGTGALALCSSDRRLLGLLTDGDIRRAILRGASLDDPCESIANLHPITARGSISAADALHLMTQRDINHLPVVDEEGTLVQFLPRRDLLQENHLGISAVIMAGGYGTRLLPLTESVPKPMLPVGDRPLLERTIEQLRRSGIRDVNLTTHYLPDHIVQHFGDGEGFGIRLTYSREDQPLGTAGGLKLRDRDDGPFLVLNGDVLTGVSFEEMLHYHRKHGAELTVGVRKYEVKVPFGVVRCDDARVIALDEKPALSFLINAGVYLLEPTACDFIPEDEHFDMTDLIHKMLEEGRTVVSFPIIEYWLDVGRHEDYQQAQEDVRNGRI